MDLGSKSSVDFGAMDADRVCGTDSHAKDEEGTVDLRGTEHVHGNEEEGLARLHAETATQAAPCMVSSILEVSLGGGLVIPVSPNSENEVVDDGAQALGFLLEVRPDEHVVGECRVVEEVDEAGRKGDVV